jgi:predicted amino acid dehydrogenase
VVLIGTPKPGSRARLEQIARRLTGSEIATDASGLRDAHVVVVAVNSVEAPLAASDFSRHAIVCDLSVPASVHALGMAGRPDVRWIRGGIVQLPFGEDLGIDGFPLPAGQVYACLAEALLLGFEGTDASFTGPVTPDRIRRVREMAARHGFEPADNGVLRRDATGAA